MSTVRGPAVGYTDLLNHATLEKINNPTEKNSYFPLRPSSSGKCTRALAYELNEFLGRGKHGERKETAESHRLLALGSYVENHLIRQFDYLKDMFKLKYKQQVLEFYPLTSTNDPSLAVVVEGSLDSVIWSDQWKCVIDYKSKKDKFSSWRSTQWDEMTDKLKRMASVETLSDTAFWVDDLPDFLKELNDPFFEDNFLQLNGYACTEFLKSRGVDHGAIIQYNKNDSRIREVRFRPSEELFRRVQAKFQAALTAVDNGDPEQARRDYALGAMKCAFCPFAKSCWGNEDSLKAWFRTFPKRDWPTKIEEVDNSDLLAAEFAELEQHTLLSKTLQATEERILNLMIEQKIERIRLENGNVYELKYLKSPKPHYELRRGK